MDRRAGGRRTGKPAYAIREIIIDDLENKFLETLSNLGETKKLSFLAARRLLLGIKTDRLHKIFVAVKENGEVIGSTTLIVEQKFIHNGGRVGHIEDVVVRKGYEGSGIGGALVRTAMTSARQLGCYKCILDCNERLAKFYEKMGFRRHELGMRMDLPQ